MLTTHQTEVIAFVTPNHGEFLCRDCATQVTSQLTVQKAELGLAKGRLEPIIRYTLEEYATESLWESLAQELDGEELQAAFDAAEPQEYCADCGRELL